MNNWPTFSARLIFWTSAAVAVGVGVGDADFDEARAEGLVADRAPDSWQADTAIAPAARAVMNFQPSVRRTPRS
jgi:hypothetical protein